MRRDSVPEIFQVREEQVGMKENMGASCDIRGIGRIYWRHRKKVEGQEGGLLRQEEEKE